MNECDVAGAGYAERQEHRQFNSVHDQGPGQYAEQNAVGYFPVSVDEQSTYQSVQANQVAYLQNLAQRMNSTPTVQRTPKTSGHTVQEVHVRFEPTSLDEAEVSKTLFQTKDTCAHDVWVEHATMNRRRVQVKIDTGARVNVMSRHHFLELGYRLETLKQSNVILVSFNQDLVRPLGCAYIETELRGKTLPMLFHIVPTCANVLICYRDAVRASLIATPACNDCDFPDFPDVDTLSIYKNEIVHLELKPDAVAKNFPTRKVPLALEDEVREELKRMEDEGVIVKENNPTDWCSPLLVRRKPNGKLRVCMDPRYLNTFLKRATYPLPDVEGVFPKFRGAKYFSKLDMTAGFWQVLLDEVSSKMCTFSTPFGRYRYLRLPFGISPAPEVFH
jgi:hypothetical protein